MRGEIRLGGFARVADQWTPVRIESGTTVAYLIESAGLRVEKIYFDTMQTFSRKKASPAPPKPRSPRATRRRGSAAPALSCGADDGGLR